MRFVSATVMLCVIALTGCPKPNGPYLRDLKVDPADPRRVTIERAYLEAMAADLEACYHARSSDVR